MANEIEKNNKEINPIEIEQTYSSVRGYIVEAQQQVYRAVNSTMVEAYWKIGKEIYEAGGENERAAYGKRILAELSERLTAEFGKGFSERNLQMMRRFYLTFQNANALRSELSWTHYRELIKVADCDARELMNEGDNPPVGILLCADKSDTLVEYTLPENDRQIYASKYLPYMPTEEELKRELNIRDFKKLEE